MTKRGVILIICLLVVIALAGASIIIFSQGVNESRFVRRHSDSTKAFWVAEAGIEKIKAQIIQDWNNRNPIADLFGNGVYFAVADSTDSYGNPLPLHHLRFYCGGSMGTSTRIVESVIESVPQGTFEYAVAAQKLIELRTGVTVHGNIYVNGDIEVQAGAGIVKEDDSVNPVDPNAYDADVFYTGNNLGISGTVEGNVSQTAEVIPVPTYDWNEVKNNADFVLNNNANLNGILADGVYYIKGDVQLNNVTLNNGAIISEGKMEINGSFNLNTPKGGIPALANQSGTIEVDGVAQVHGLIYCAGDSIELKTGTIMHVYGSVVAASDAAELKTLGGATIDVYYKPEYIAGQPNSTLKILSWRELQNPYRLAP
ncbi:MAG: hypothetical protein ABH872_02160 [Candidatus Omnitrophota bacterium]